MEKKRFTETLLGGMQSIFIYVQCTFCEVSFNSEKFEVKGVILNHSDYFKKVRFINIIYITRKDILKSLEATLWQYC